MRHGQMVRVGMAVIVAGMLARMAGAAGEPPAATAVAQPGAGARAVPGQAWSLDLGGGVKTEFVWIEALKGWVGKYEVTNEEYRRFKPDHRSGDYHGPPVTPLDGDRLPVCSVCYTEAVAFSEWATRTASAQLPAGHVVRLPDGDEWTVFAQCGDERKFPWGNEWPPKYGNYRDETGAKAFAHWQGLRIAGYDDGFDIACPVEQSSTNDWGLYGVGGNVWELTSQIQGENRTMRGGSWHRHDQGNISCGIRRSYPRTSRDSGVGFRVVALPAAAAPAAPSAPPSASPAKAEPQAAPALPGNNTSRSTP